MKNKKKNSYSAQFYVRNKLNYFISIICLILYCLMQIYIAKLLQLLTDVAANRDKQQFYKFLISSLLFLIVLTITQLFYKNSKFKFIKKASMQLKERIFVDITNKNINAFSNESTSTYISILNNDLRTIEDNILLGNYNIIKNIFLFVLSIAMMLYYNWTIAIVVIVFSFVPFLTSIPFTKKLSFQEKEVSNNNDIFTRLVKDLLSGFTVIKSFSAEKEINKLFKEKNEDTENAKYKRRALSMIIGIISGGASFISEIVIFSYCAYLAINGKVSVGIMMAFVQLMNYILEPLSELPTLLSNKKASNELLNNIEEKIQFNQFYDGLESIEIINDGITLENVCFGYEDSNYNIIKNVSFKFEKGKSYAIVGESGSGKSTLLNLLIGSYSDYNGNILFDNKELNSLKRSSIYNLVSIIQQNVFVFNSSIYDNISMFKGFDEEKMHQAIKKSGLEGVINRKGIAYLCGDNGINLSGGEKQRISIARALLKNTSVLLMDEATSALDMETYQNVQNAILDIKDMTRIVVTHQMEKIMLMKYDKILVMDNGEIKEVGSYEELIKNNGYFSKIFIK